MGLINSVLFSSRTPQMLQKTLNMQAQKAATHAQNISNAETPGYKASRFEFESVLRGAVDAGQTPLRTTHNGHMGGLSRDIPSIQGITDIDLSQGRLDGNNVDMEREMAAFSETQISYDAAITAMNKRSSIVRSAITDLK